MAFWLMGSTVARASTPRSPASSRMKAANCIRPFVFAFKDSCEKTGKEKKCRGRGEMRREKKDDGGAFNEKGSSNAIAS